MSHSQVVRSKPKEDANQSLKHVTDWEQFLASMVKDQTLPIHIKENICQAILGIVSNG